MATIEDKRIELEEFCDSHENCDDCIFNYNRAWCNRRATNNIPEDELDKALQEIKDNEPIFATDANAGSKYDRHKKICEGMNLVYRAKNEDYGDSFAKGFREYGVIMPVIRLEDKLNRFKQLMLKGGQRVEGESVKDTLVDLANYAIMTIIELEDRINGND